MPGAATFAVLPSEITGAWNNGESTTWARGVPSLIPAIPNLWTPPTGVADCHALEANTPPTLRTAYSIYGVSIPWSAVAVDPQSPTGNFLVELALLVNGEVHWTGTDKQAGAVGLAGNSPWIATGIVTGDLVNPVRINPRERLSLRLSIATDVPLEAVSPAVAMTYIGYVGATYTTDATTPFTPAPGTISYSIIDLPGNRSL